MTPHPRKTRIPLSINKVPTIKPYIPLHKRWHEHQLIYLNYTINISRLFLQRHHITLDDSVLGHPDPHTKMRRDWCSFCSDADVVKSKLSWKKSSHFTGKSIFPQ